MNLYLVEKSSSVLSVLEGSQIKYAVPFRGGGGGGCGAAADFRTVMLNGR